MVRLRYLSAALLAASMVTGCASIAGLGDTRVLEDSSDAQAPSAAGDAGRDGGDAGHEGGIGADAGDDGGAGSDAGSMLADDAGDGTSADASPDASPDAASNAPDTAYPAVVALRHKNGAFFCSGTLISPQVVLTSARCFPAFANGCAPLHGANGEADSNEVVLSPSGVLGASDNIARDIDDLEAAPSSYPIRRNDCPSGSPASCPAPDDADAGVGPNGDAGTSPTVDAGGAANDDAGSGPNVGSGASEDAGSGPGGDAGGSPSGDAGGGGSNDAGSNDGGSNDASSNGGGGLGASDDGGLGLRIGSDLLLIHLLSPAPDGIQPIPVLTSLGDESFDGGSTVHAALDSNPAFSNRAQAPLPHIAGWGTPACTNVERRAGLAQFETIGPNPGDWHKGCAEWFACDLSTRVDLGCTLTDILGGVTDSLNGYATNEVRISNTNSTPGVFDGPTPPNGDIGSPVLIDGQDLSGLPVTYAIGTLSVPPPPNDCGVQPAGHASSRYSATFTAENGAWIEKTLAYWSGAFYPWVGTWASWQGINTGTGAIGGSPAAESQGSGRVDSFVVGADDTLYGEMWNGEYWYTENGPLTWDSARGTYDTVTSAPSACSWGPDRIDIVARVADGSVMHWWYVDGWLNESLGGFALAGTGPTIATWGPNSTLHVFVIGGDAHLYYKSKIAVPDQNEAGEGWPADWVDLGAYLAQGASSPAATAWAPGRLDVFAQRTDGALVHLFEDADAAQLGWQVSVLPSPALAAGAGVGLASWMPGRLDLAVTDAADPTSIVWFGRSSQGWHANAPQTILTGVFPGSTPALASWAPGRLDLFAQPPAGSAVLYHSWFGSK